jgi:RNA polymerase sigma factor (sigma-70 family)
LRGEGDERREFLRAIDAVKKRVQRGRKWVAYPDQVADDRTDPDKVRAEQREELRQAADELLSERQRLILQRSIEGYSVQEIAEELGVGPERVSDDKYKAIRKLRAHLCVG